MKANQETIQEIATIANAIQAGLQIITKSHCAIDVVHFLPSGARFTFTINSQAYPANTILGKVHLPVMIKALESHVQAGTATNIPMGRFVQVDSHTYHFLDGLINLMGLSLIP